MSTLFRSTIDNFFIPDTIDGLVLFGNALFTTQPDERRKIFEQAYENFSNKSTFIFTFLDSNQLKDRYSDADIYTVDGLKLRRNSITVAQGGDELTQTYSFRVSEANDDYTKLQFGFSDDGYCHNPQDIDTELKNIGFKNTTIIKPDDILGTVVIARKIS